MSNADARLAANERGRAYTREALLVGRRYIWTLPLSPNRYARLELPSRSITAEEWAQLVSLLDVFKPGLIVPEAEEDDVDEVCDG